MGSGSSTEISAHLKKWDQAVNDLSSLCRDHRRALDNQSPTNDGYRSESSRETESHAIAKKNVVSVGQNADLNKSQPDDDVTSERSLRRRTSSLVSFGGKQKPADVIDGPLKSPSSKARADILLTPEESPQNRTADGVKEPRAHKNRQQVKDIKQGRTELYKSYVDVPIDKVENALACNHFAVVAVALSSLMGGHRGCEDRRKRVTVEDLFFAAQIPLHNLHHKDISLTEMYDIVREFIDVDNRFRNQYSVEVVHLDIAPTVGQVEIGLNETGDRQARIQLPEFRKSVAQELEEDTDCVRIVDYDPFIIEQAMIMDEDGEASDEGEPDPETLRNSFCAAVSPVARGKKPHWHQQKYKKDNNGKFAALVDFRSLAVQPMVTIAEAVVDDKIHVALSEVPVATLFKAMSSSKPGSRAKGYIRVWKKRDGEDGTSSNAQGVDPAANDVAFMYSPELSSGKVLGSLMEGTHAHLISQKIAPHIIAVAWALHLLKGVRPDSHGYGTGLPVHDIITTLRLPADVFLDCPLPLDQVHIYAADYLRIKGLDARYTLQLCPVLTKISRDDAVPTVSVFDLEGILIELKNSNEDPEAPSHVMIIQYNADIAHNALNIAVDPQWCILAGYDEDNQMARLIDANPGRFCASWTVPLDRLHKSITNFGYLVMSNSQPANARSSRSSQSSAHSANNTSYTVGGLRHVTSTVQQRLDLLSQQSKRFGVRDVISYFAYPPSPFAITQIAVALTRLGEFTTFEDIVHALPYDVSSLLSPILGLESFAIVLRDYVARKGHASRFTVTAMHADRDTDKIQGLPLQKFQNLLRACVSSPDAADFVLIVHYAKQRICVFGANQPMGEYGIVTAFNEETGAVTVSDVNPNRFFRSWEVPMHALYEAISKTSASAHRPRGCIVVQRLKEPVAPEQPPRFRDFHLCLVPVQQIFNCSPSPQMQGLSLACAQLGHSYSPEEIFYEAYLKTMTDQRRRGSQAFAWRDVEVSLAMVNKRITAHIMALVMRKFLESRKIFSLGAEVIDDVDAHDVDALLKEATEPTATFILLLNYNTEIAHGLSGFGNSVALVQGYDPEAKRVSFFDAEYTLFGLQWSCSLETLVEAGDLDNDGRSDYGFVKISIKDGNGTSGTNLVGRGFNFGSASNEASGGAASHPFGEPSAGDGRSGGGHGAAKATFVE